MHTQETVNLIRQQWNTFISKNTKFEIIAENDIQVITSFIDYFGDGILFDILENDNNDFTLTDKGYTFWNMSMNNIDLTKKQTTRYRLLHWYLKSFGFELHNEIIQKTKVTKKNLSQSIMDFIQLLLRISDLGMTSRANTRGMFLDDAQKYFESQKNKYYYSTNSILVGETDQQYRIEYNFTPQLGVNKFTKLYNTLSKNNMEALIGIYTDTSDYLESNYRTPSFNVLVNDIENTSSQIIEGLKKHKIQVINFQDKNDVEKNFGLIA